ncbi:MAG: thymidylate synthase, partial [Niameybacter sp.]
MGKLDSIVIAKTANEAWEVWFKTLKGQADSGVNATSRDGDVSGEVINAITIIEDPTHNIITNPIRKMPMRYAIGELLWYLSGSNLVSDINHFSSIWNTLSDDGKTINSAYGNRIFDRFGFDQWEYIKTLLTDDPNSRQAVIHIKDASQKKTKDMPCTVCLQYFIRDGKLHATTYMRSNDIWLGFPYDVFSF